MSDTPRTDAFEALTERPINWWDFARELERENAALRAELKRQRALWQATYALGLAERDFAIKCIETALGPNKAQSWGDDQIMRQCLNEGGTPT